MGLNFLQFYILLLCVLIPGVLWLGYIDYKSSKASAARIDELQRQVGTSRTTRTGTYDDGGAAASAATISDGGSCGDSGHCS